MLAKPNEVSADGVFYYDNNSLIDFIIYDIVGLLLGFACYSVVPLLSGNCSQYWVLDRRWHIYGWSLALPGFV